VLRAVATALFAWTPLAVASVLAGARPGTDVSFFGDVAVHVRFLLVVPLLILADASIGPRSRLVVCEFLKSGLIEGTEMSRYESAVQRARHLLNSALAEIVMILAAIGMALLAARAVTSEEIVFWFEHASGAGAGMTPAGWWYAFIATPIVMFLFLRWMWRYLIWIWFLRRVSKMRLSLSATHPDLMGGLGFVAFHQTVFARLTLAASCGAAAAAANRILHSGADLNDHLWAVAAFTVLAVVIGVAPLLSFTAPLVRLKRRGIFEYGRVATDYVLSFERKWLGDRPPRDEPLLGSGDIQSLADIGGSFQRVQGMKVALVDRRITLSFAAAAIVPALPLLLTSMPFKDIARLLIKIVV
jgi:hypothetical protein